MPPKSKFTRTEIVTAALDLVREQGVEALTARELGKQLGSSSRPIFTLFENMEEVHREVYAAASQHFENYTKEAMRFTPAFKQLGMLMIRFALEEPKLYQLLFMRQSEKAYSFQDMLSKFGTLDNTCLEIICRDYDLSLQDARALLESVWIHTYGIGVLCATGMCRFSEAELQEMVGRNFRGMMMLVKAGRLQEAVVIPKEVF